MSEPHWLAETRASYDVVAASYAAQLEGELEQSPTDRHVLALFAELAGEGARVVDAGCGPGRITAHLATLGLDASGIDLSPAMVAEARRRHPELTFEVGDLRALPLADASINGAVAWYSLIHLPPDQLPLALTELHRVLAPGGVLVAAFQVGDEIRRIRQGYGHEVGMDAWRMDPAQVADAMSAAGFDVHTQLVRQPAAEEKSPQAYLPATRL